LTSSHRPVVRCSRSRSALADDASESLGRPLAEQRARQAVGLAGVSGAAGALVALGSDPLIASFCFLPIVWRASRVAFAFATASATVCASGRTTRGAAKP